MPNEDAHQELIDSLRSLSVTPERPARPGYGTVGAKTIVEANFLPVKLPAIPLYEYTITISPKPRSARERKQIFKLLGDQSDVQEFQSYIAHDSSQRLISAKVLPETLRDVIIPYHEDEEEPTDRSIAYTISFARKGELDLNQLNDYIEGKPEARNYDIQPTIGALDLVFQQHANSQGFRVGKNKYFIPSKARRYEIGPGIEALQGFYLSVRPVYKQLMVNVNPAVTAFFKPGNLADALLTFGLRSRGAAFTFPNGVAERIKFTVKTLHTGFRKKVKKIGTTSARNTKFPTGEGKNKRLITVEQYFKEHYPNIELKHPDDVPVVDLSGPNSPHPVWVPAELCEILPGQPLFDLSEKHVKNMIMAARRSPSENRAAILESGLPSLGLAPRQPPMDCFGIQVSNQLTTVEARELPAPTVTYHGEKKVNVRDGSWNFVGQKFHKGATVTDWWVVVVGSQPQGHRDPQITDLVNAFDKMCRDSGMNMPPKRQGPRYIDIPLFQQKLGQKERKEVTERIRNKFKEEIEASGKPSLALILLESEISDIYPDIKRIGDLELGLVTNHVRLDKLSKNNRPDQYHANVTLKVNTKLGGISHKLDAAAMAWLRTESTMMVGIDVSHPGVRAIFGSPSIAAVVANLDDEFVQYPASLRIQAGRQEMVQELKEMMIERLILYKKTNKKLPQRIFVFRDGVSEGQYDLVNKTELPQILAAFAAFSTEAQGGNYRPKLSIVVCGKRHNARFSPTDGAHETRNGNTKPGTVVDKGVTAVFDFDFYLQAHAGIQGHVKSTHYTVVYDENCFEADEIQQGTHNASYLYARASKAVSLVPPAYYADLASKRARCYLNDFLTFEDPEKNKEKGKGKGKDRDAEKERVFNLAKAHWGQGLHDDIKDTMLYM